MLWQKLRELREVKGLVQRQVAAKSNVDTVYMIKIECDEKPLSPQHLKKLSSLPRISKVDLFTFCLADKILNVVDN